MTSATKRFSEDLNIDDSLTTEGIDSELSLADDTDDLLEVFSGTLAFGEQHRNASLNFETDLPGDPSHPDVHGCSDARSGQARIAFEIVNANIVGEGRQKYVAYTILVLKGPGINTADAAIQRRYSDFEKLHSSLKSRFQNELRGISFPKKMLTGNFKAETIAQRSRAFEQYLCHVYSIHALRVSREFISFFYEDDLRKAYEHIRTGNYRTSLPLLNASLLLQQRLQGETHPEVLATQCALIAVHAEMDQYHIAQDYAESAFQCIGNDNTSPYMPPLLQLSIRLCWKMGKDKKDLEERQHQLKTQGVNVDNIPPLITLVKERFSKNT